MKSQTTDEWLARMKEMLAGSDHDAERARWKMGFTSGRRFQTDKITAKLAEIGLIWWDENQSAWLSCMTGEPIKSIDYRENGYQGVHF
jgi:hypothetical protein